VTDVFRKQYRELSEAEKNHLSSMKLKAEELFHFLNDGQDVLGGDPRATSLAKTKLEEAVMWATKAVTR
jgi:hypothetical protein